MVLAQSFTAFPCASLSLAKCDNVLALLWAPCRERKAHFMLLHSTLIGSTDMVLFSAIGPCNCSPSKPSLCGRTDTRCSTGFWVCLCSNMGNRCACKEKKCVSAKLKVCEKCLKQSPADSCDLDPGTPQQHTSDALQRPQRLDQCLPFW